MSEMLVVNFAALQQASGDIQRAVGSLQSQLGQLEHDARPLVTTWSGEAQQAYEERQRGWRNAAEELSTILRDIQRAIESSANNYRETERRNAGMFQ